MEELIASLILSLLFTEAMECGFAWGRKKRGKALGLVALVNVVTVPIVVLLSYLLGGSWLVSADLEVVMWRRRAGSTAAAASLNPPSALPWWPTSCPSASCCW